MRKPLPFALAKPVKAWRLRDGVRDVRPPAVAAGAAFASTLAAAGAIGLERRRPLWPWAAWRAGLAAVVLAVRHNRAR